MKRVWKSRPVWGAWIDLSPKSRSRRHRDASRPVWGAWIEIRTGESRALFCAVAPRMGRVD